MECTAAEDASSAAGSTGTGRRARHPGHWLVLAGLLGAGGALAALGPATLATRATELRLLLFGLATAVCCIAEALLLVALLRALRRTAAPPRQKLAELGWVLLPALLLAALLALSLRGAVL